MKITKFLNKPIVFFITSAMVLLCTFILNLAITFMAIPDNIYLLAGYEHQITSNLPFTAIINTAEVQEAVNVNDKQVTDDNIVFTLNEGITVASEDETQLNMSLQILGLPVRNVSLDILPDTEVVPCGKTVGVRINTAGVMILGTGAVEAEGGKSLNPSANVLRSGDLVIEADRQQIMDKSQFTQIIESSEGKKIEIKLKRENENVTVDITPVKSVLDDKFKIGAWIRDGTQGIGTLTYYNPSSKAFGALGHGILDVDTRKLMTVKSGKIMESSIDSVKKGKKGSPGELSGNINDDSKIGSIKSNTTLGIYGYMENIPNELNGDAVKIALKSEIHEGPAKIRSNVSGTQVSEYDVFIESVNRYSQDESKGMIVRITDPELLARTNGIVQGMSGSPIIQDGKLVGAITHVFVQNPTRGYGIFIENMIKQEKKM